MKCPYCDSRVSPVPDNRVCPHCGGPLGEPKSPDLPLAEPKEYCFPTPPLGVYKGVSGHMEIKEKSVFFFKKLSSGKLLECEVPYEELASVFMDPPSVFFAGFLCVRSWQDRHIPFSKKRLECIYDEAAVGFYYEDKKKYTRAYEFLKQCAEIANKVREG